jgi:hypothetical protein
MSFLDRATSYVKAQVNEHKQMIKKEADERAAEATERQRKIDAVKNDPITIEQPYAFQLQDLIIYEVDVELISIVRSLRANGAGEFADVLKMLFPIMEWVHYDQRVSDFAPDFFQLAVAKGGRASTDLWEYIWIRRDGWTNADYYANFCFNKSSKLFDIWVKLPEGKQQKQIQSLESKYHLASSFINSTYKVYGNSYFGSFDAILHGASNVKPWDELSRYSRPKSEFESRYRYVYERRLLGQMIAKLLLFERDIVNKYEKSNYEDVLDDSQFASLVKSLSVDTIDINLAASVMNKFSDRVMRDDLLEVDSFSTAFLNDLISVLNSVVNVFERVITFADNQREVNKQHAHDMERAKTLDYLNENIKPLDSFKDGFKIEDIGTANKLDTDDD